MSRNDSAKYAFFYVLSLVALIFMAISVGTVFFQIINKAIADVANQYSGRYSDESIKFAISAIIISAPIYYFTAKQVYKNLRSGKLEADSAVRKWFTYLILLVSIVVMIVWLIMTINGFLGGELTTKFILKAITALAISGAIFSFYLYDIRRENVLESKDNVLKIYFIASLVVVVAALIIAFMVVESPAETRQRKIDERIVSGLYQIDSAINEYYRLNDKLPENLDQLREEVNYILESDLVNPITNDTYQYSVVSDNEYKICTTFQSSNRMDVEDSYGYYPDKTWLHDAGQQCFDKKVVNIEGVTKEPRFID